MIRQQNKKNKKSINNLFVSERSFGKKGFYSIIMAFFVIVALVFAFLWFINLYGVIFGINSNDTKNLVVEATLFKDRLLLCQQKSALSEEKLNNNICTDITNIQGYSVQIKQGTILGCDEQLWEYPLGSNFAQNTNLNQFVFWLPVEMEDDTECLARLFVYL